MKITVHANANPYFTVRRITTISLLSAIAIVMSIVPGLGYIYIGVIKATFMHIPVIIAAIVEGPIAGAIVGLIFGISSLIINLSGPLAPIFINPLVSVFPRVMIGIISAYVYRWIKISKMSDRQSFKKARARLAVPVAAAVGTMVNTAGVLGMIYLVSSRQFAEINGVTMANMGKILVGVALTNGVAELCLAVILVTIIIKSINSIRR